MMQESIFISDETDGFPETDYTGHCQTLDVTLSNDILKQLPAYNGIYQLINLVNGRPSWILEDSNKGIWFSQGRNEWVLGDKGLFLS